MRCEKNLFPSETPKLFMFSPENRQSFLHQLAPKIVQLRLLSEKDESALVARRSPALAERCQVLPINEPMPLAQGSVM